MVDCLVWVRFFKAQVDRQAGGQAAGGQLEAVQQVEIVSPPPQVCAERNIHVHTQTHAHSHIRQYALQMVF